MSSNMHRSGTRTRPGRYHTLRVYGDVSCKDGNAAVGWCVLGTDPKAGALLERDGTEVGLLSHAEGEYLAALYALDAAAPHEASRVVLYTDSDQAAEAIQNEWTHEPYMRHVSRIQRRLNGYDRSEVWPVDREENQIAHEEARRACPGVSVK
ncbi:reverse transcriptase-like protein [Halococcus saccharolyticus]|nr:reverse transcriptase-like protein [Halococcus saccharolyticus]